jgi:hypothetical protein
MKRHLQRAKEAQTKSQDVGRRFLEQFEKPSADVPGELAAEERVTNLFFAASDAAAESTTAAAEAAPVEMPGDADPSPSAGVSDWKKQAKSRHWLTRLLLGDPVDPRRAPRETLPGLIAYFFTGGTPVGQPVREISATGLYIITSERWYLGTVIRLTLTDRHRPTMERSITVNAKAVRWGNDGVGLEFVLAGKDRRKSEIIDRDERTNGVDATQVEEFLRNFKSPAT